MTAPVHVQAHAPVRICDVGGWSDTWFATYGRVCSLAVEPGVRVEIHPTDAATVISIGNEAPRTLAETWLHHPLIAAAIAEIPLPSMPGWHVTIRSDMPPGCATGTSAAVAVALLSALARVRGDILTAFDATCLAHTLETRRLGLQSGIQDQIGAAYGGINDIQISSYPDFHVTPCQLSTQTLAALNQQLQLWYLGRPHQSSKIHEDVIRRFETVPSAQELLNPLRQAAADAVEALRYGDLARYGMALQQNTNGQRALHPALICPDAEQIIDIAKRAGALGWKVNGAGGDGGSVSILWPTAIPNKRAVESIHATIPNAVTIPITISMTGVTTNIITKEDA